MQLLLLSKKSEAAKLHQIMIMVKGGFNALEGSNNNFRDGKGEGYC